MGRLHQYIVCALHLMPLIRKSEKENEMKRKLSLKRQAGLGAPLLLKSEAWPRTQKTASRAQLEAVAVFESRRCSRISRAGSRGDPLQ